MNLAHLSDKAARLSEPLLEVCARFGIDTPLRKAHFLAQCAHESAGFSRFVENLNYSAESLRKVFPRYFPTAASAAAYHRQPAKIANFVYANRMGNGDVDSGEGWEFRGRGGLHLSGKRNYAKASRALYGDDRLVQTPGLVALPPDAVLTAGWFWDANDLNALADRDDIEAVTRCVNGGLNGLEDRRQWLVRAKEAVKQTPGPHGAHPPPI